MSMSRKPYASDVSDCEWALVAPYLTLLPEESAQRTHALRASATFERHHPIARARLSSNDDLAESPSLPGPSPGSHALLEGSGPASRSMALPAAIIVEGVPAQPAAADEDPTIPATPAGAQKQPRRSAVLHGSHPRCTDSRPRYPASPSQSKRSRFCPRAASPRRGPRSQPSTSRTAIDRANDRGEYFRR
jgi:hypothetical protein